MPVGTQVTFVALSPQRDHVVCRLLNSTETFPFRGKDNWQLHPAELVHATLTKPWRPTGGRAIWARMDKREFNIPALNLIPLKLLDEHPWDPHTPSAIKVGRCLSYEMEVVTPGWDPADPSTDPIERATERNAGYDFEGARHILTNLLVQDLRCLGAFEFDHYVSSSFVAPNEYFEAGFQIGALSLGENFRSLSPGRASAPVISSAACTAMALPIGAFSVSTPRTTKASASSSTTSKPTKHGKIPNATIPSASYNSLQFPRCLLRQRRHHCQ